MNMLRRLLRFGTPKASTQDSGPGHSYSATDPALLEAIRSQLSGGKSAEAMCNGALNRAVRLHCETLAMLPLHLMHADDQKGKATEHPVFRVLHRRPNNWQTPYEFKRLMQYTLLKNGAAYAQIVKSGDRILQLQPLSKFRVEPKQNLDWSITYELTSPNGVKSTLRQGQVLAIRDIDTSSGVHGESRIDQARDAVKMTSSIKSAVQKLFDNGMHVGGSIESQVKLGKEARDAVRESMNRLKGAERAGEWLLLDGFTAKPFENTLADNQQVENLAWQIQEIGRIFGTPRPLLMLDDTSWGSGIEALGQFFVTYGLAPIFVNWEQAVSRDLLSEEEQALYEPKFNEGALLRGSHKDQAEVFAKALGSGGHDPWMTVDEVREKSDLPAKGRDDLPARAGAKTGESNVAPSVA